MATSTWDEGRGLDLKMQGADSAVLKPCQIISKNFQTDYGGRMQGSRFAFGPFVLDSAAGTLLRNDVPVAVGHRGLKLLAALVGRPGEILGKAELMDAAWPGTAVEDGNLTVQIAQL